MVIIDKKYDFTIAINPTIEFEKGDTIWTQLYSHEEMRYIRIPWWTVAKTRAHKDGTQKLWLVPYGYYNKFMM